MQLTHQKESDLLRKQVLSINSEMSELIHNVEWLHSRVQTESDPAKRLKLASQLESSMKILSTLKSTSEAIMAKLDQFDLQTGSENPQNSDFELKKSIEHMSPED
jgi:hypothetical protein